MLAAQTLVVGLVLDTSGIGGKKCRRFISRIKIGYIEIAVLICFQRKFIIISLKREISNNCRHVPMSMGVRPSRRHTNYEESRLSFSFPQPFTPSQIPFLLDMTSFPTNLEQEDLYNTFLITM